jgi:hypothetical protein
MRSRPIQRGTKTMSCLAKEKSAEIFKDNTSPGESLYFPNFDGHNENRVEAFTHYFSMRLYG